MLQKDLHSNPKKPSFSRQEQDSPDYDCKMNPVPDYGLNSYKATEELQDKIAIITDDDSNIDRAVAWAFACEGAIVIISYLNEHEVQKKFNKLLVKLVDNPGDISKEEQCKKIIDITLSKFQRIDILVNNAAFQEKALSDYSEYLVKQMILDNNREAIINVGSVQGYNPSAEIIDYATTKAAIVGFTKGLARKLLEKGIRVNCVAPGTTWTPLVMSSFPKNENVTFAEGCPIIRLAQPRELAPAADSSYISE
ncbi:unnamed protein product [Rotaria sordida]|uniref:Uncharacterized protein n=1 Tax=Rotaria sordida TaxID=392033 RepID=A0A819K169_9BILA|nr:unnamed protein product [Rotaria sordida]CAF3936763.1 unnamed protein product [Rotaria sordida]